MGAGARSRRDDCPWAPNPPCVAEGRAAQLASGALEDHLRTAHVSPSDRATFSRILTRLWADDLLPPATAPRPRFFARAQIYSIDANASHRAQEFLEFKIAAATHAREQILMVLNRGVTTYEAVRDATTGAPSGLTRETQSFVELFHLRLWLDLLLFELVGVEEALLQAANIAFNVGVSPRDPDLRDKIQAELVGQSERTLQIPSPPAGASTGIESWRGPAQPGASTRLRDLRELRHQATHRHLVGMREHRPWSGGGVSPPVEPAKLRSEFYVDLGKGREEPLDQFAALAVDEVVRLVNASCGRFASLLWMLTDYHGGPVAATRRRAWQRSSVTTACAHETVEPRLDKDGVALDPYFCSQCGLRVENPAGKRSPDGSTYL